MLHWETALLIWFFSNHWYPNINISNVNNSITNSNVIPVVIGEVGQINPGTTGVVAQYVKDVLNAVVNTGISRGHNGVFPWLWNWCDENSMTNDDYQTLNTYGQIYTTNYFSKL